MAHSIFELLRNLLVEYGYWALAVTLVLENAGIPVPGETILLLASFLAYSEHRLQLPWIIAVGTVAAAIGDNLGFALGYYGGRRLCDRYRKVFRIRPATLERGEDLFARYGAVTVFFARFVFGMRIIAGPLAGALRMQWKKFLMANVCGAAVWVTVISAAGYLFGRQWNVLAERVKRFDLAIGILLIAVAAYWWWHQRAKSRE